MELLDQLLLKNCLEAMEDEGCDRKKKCSWPQQKEVPIQALSADNTHCISSH